MNRRDLLRALGATSVVVGFNPVRGWVTLASARAGGTFDEVPPLQGTLRLDERSRAAVATDQGNIKFAKPQAVLLPASAADIAAMIKFCRPRGIRVSPRGEGHTTHGHSLTHGLVVEMSSLSRIHSIDPGGAVVDGGTLWRDLIVEAYAERLTPPAITGYTKLSVGGTLSVGGVPGIAGSTFSGCQIDRVQSLEVVTGAGDVVECSPTQNPQLFEVMLGGLGQCGIITRATVDLVPARRRARSYLLHYVDNRLHFADFRTLLGRPGLDQVYTQWFPPGTSKVYQLNAVVFYDLLDPPKDLSILRGMRGIPAVEDLPYLQYIFLVDQLIDGLRLTGWDELVKPWFDVWLPDSAIESYVGSTVPTLGPLDVGLGFLLIFPVKRSRITRPFFRVPPADGNGWVYLFDILTSSLLPGPDPGFAERMLARNRRLFDAAGAAGGVRYPIGSVDFTAQDWMAHYGERWSDLVSRKHQFDPDGILTPGPGIFS